VRDSCGSSGTGETPQALEAPRRLSARPAESKHPGVEVNTALIATMITKRAFCLKTIFSESPEPCLTRIVPDQVNGRQV
jgi:hypothetical protein